MQYTLSINQTKALEWGLNAQQALLFSFVYECPSWCKAVTKDDTVFYALSKQKIIDELPLLTDKIDTAYRLLKQLAAKGMIELSHTSSITLVRLTDVGKTWNHDHKGSEKYPSNGRKILRQIKIPVILLMTLARPAARTRSIVLITNTPMRPTLMSVPSRQPSLKIRSCPTCLPQNLTKPCRLG